MDFLSIIGGRLDFVLLFDGGVGWRAVYYDYHGAGGWLVAVAPMAVSSWQLH